MTLRPARRLPERKAGSNGHESFVARVVRNEPAQVEPAHGTGADE